MRCKPMDSNLGGAKLLARDAGVKDLLEGHVGRVDQHRVVDGELLVRELDARGDALDGHDLGAR